MAYINCMCLIIFYVLILDAFEKTINKFKHLDIVINNAGILNELQWEKCIAINLVIIQKIIYTNISTEKFM